MLWGADGPSRPPLLPPPICTQGSTGSDQLRGKQPSLNPYSARMQRASDYTPLLLPTSTLSSVLDSGLSEGLLKDSFLTHLSVARPSAVGWGPAGSMSGGGGGKQWRWGRGCLQREACTIAQESPPAPSRGCLYPHQVTPSLLRGEERD